MLKIYGIPLTVTVENRIQADLTVGMVPGDIAAEGFERTGGPDRRCGCQFAGYGDIGEIGAEVDERADDEAAGIYIGGYA